MKEHILQGTVYVCGCGSPVKPDVILFGENLPAFFSSEIPKIKDADLVIVSGSSLKVYPFAYLIDLIKSDTPVVLVNFENPISKHFEKFLFLQGDIEANFTELSNEIFSL